MDGNKPPAYVVDNSASPQAALHPVPLGAVRLTDTFWEPRRRVNREVTLLSQHRKLEGTGRIDNFRRAAGKIDGEFRGRYYNDSDVYKWIEACAFALAKAPDTELERLVDAVIGEIADAQRPDGYINTYFAREREAERWSNLRDKHELYCAGHLVQAAVAHHRCTGGRTLLDVAVRFADLICDVFGAGGQVGTCGHQEVEMALVELYRLTRERRYLEQAQLFIERRGQDPPVLGGGAYHQDHAPFRELYAVTGHAVRMVYYCCGAVDVLAEGEGGDDYAYTLQTLWRSMTERRMYVTGGIGSRYDGEAFGEDFELPNDRAYAESCAAIGSIMWSWRMLQMSGYAKYADLIETTLYNAFLPSLSLDGEAYFYQNPLADAGGHRRQPWFECACCPPNIARMLAALPAYCYSVSPPERGVGIWLHLYAEGDAEIPMPDGSQVRLEQRTRYPWDGEVEIRLPEAAGELALHLRIPAWAEGYEVMVNGERFDAFNQGETGYVVVAREWRAGDMLRLSLPMPVRRIRSHPWVTNNHGRVALARGPLIYCVEQVDVDGVDPRDIALPRDAEVRAEWMPELLGGVVALRGRARDLGVQPALREPLYHSQDGTVPFTAVPYHAWANREPGGMAVWILEA